MPSIILSENESSGSLQPFSLIRKVADIRMGFFTFRERWERISGTSAKYVEEVNPAFSDTDKHIQVPQNLLPLDPGINHNMNPGFRPDQLSNYFLLDKPWQIAAFNHLALNFDFSLAVDQRSSATIPEHVKISGAAPVFIEPGARLEHCTINSSDGPVYIGKNAFVMDGSNLRGPLYIGEGAVIKMGSTIYGASTIGPYCIAGGEIKNSVLSGYSNKAHQGYLGDSVIGEWCNLGAGTSTSNMKNTGGAVKVWNMNSQAFESAGNKCGLIMGDFSKAAINTSFNTGTVTGICANIFNAQQLSPKFIPSFSWGTGPELYDLHKAFEEIKVWMAFKQRVPDQQLFDKLSNLYYNTK